MLRCAHCLQSTSPQVTRRISPIEFAMKLISSRDNLLYKELKHLATNAQARRKAGRTLLDGVHLCETYVQRVGTPVICVVGQDAIAHAEVAAILKQCESATECIVLPEPLYGALSQVENGISVMFVIETPQASIPATLKAASVLLDNLQDPGNFGSIIRSAAAAGIVEVFCSPGTTAAWSPKALRSGMGAHFFLDIFENVDLAALVKTSEIPVLATSSHAFASLYEIDLNRPVAWLFGHEGQGVEPVLLEMATHQIAIPHLGEIESLNVAASAAVCFFEQVRQKSR
jgi:TrmH family RNA methyltransferase